jgi:predicted XRE-type DNA-binding protein
LADIGFPHAAERQAKLRLAYSLNQVLQARKLSQADAADVLGVTQPKVSALLHYKLAGFSVERGRFRDAGTIHSSPQGGA